MLIMLIKWMIRVSIMVLFGKVVISCWILPILAHRKLKRNGFEGPSPSFPLGNITEMKKIMKAAAAATAVTNGSSSNNLSHDIHSTIFPHFAQWQNSYGN